MYQPSYFSETDNDRIINFLLQHPFATIIAHQNGSCFATQVPLLIEQREDALVLKGHIFKYADHCAAIANSDELLILFTGAHCYVSASWYNQQGQASTWNYMSVQVRGKATMLDNKGTLEIIKDLTNQYESQQPQPELVENMSDTYLSENLTAIVGFEVIATDIKATFKLNQNKDDDSYKNVVAQLQNTNEYNSMLIAENMKQIKPELFT